MELIKRIIKEWGPYVIILILVLLVKAYIVTPIRVNGPSMDSTLKDGDIMFLNEITYRFNKIERFDIIVIKYEDEFIIKRVIGLPGEEISYKDNKLYINGKYVKEDFKHKDTKDFDSIKISNNQYFVMGDNRVNSLDSRVIGPILKENIKGKAKLTIFPFKRFGIKK